METTIRDVLWLMVVVVVVGSSWALACELPTA